MDDAKIGRVAAQHTAAEWAGQPARACVALRSWLSGAPPWIVLAVWLAVHSASVIYWLANEWPAFLGDLWLLLVCAGDVLGLTVWLVAWTALGDQRLRWRLTYLGLGLAAIGLLTWQMFHWFTDDDSLVYALAAVATGVATPLVWLRRRGRRIRREPAKPEAPPQRLWQFSLVDLLLVTTAMAIWLSLLLVGGRPGRFEVVLISAQIAAATIVLLVSLSWKRFVLAAPACFLVTILIMAAGMVVVDPKGVLEISNISILAFFAVPALLSLLVAVGVMRRCGYRLRAS